jgi:hypothetical protein
MWIMFLIWFFYGKHGDTDLSLFRSEITLYIEKDFLVDSLSSQSTSDNKLEKEQRSSNLKQNTMTEVPGP